MKIQVNEPRLVTIAVKTKARGIYSVRLVPGGNEVSDDDWSEMRTNPDVRRLAETGLITVDPDSIEPKKVHGFDDEVKPKRGRPAKAKSSVDEEALAEAQALLGDE